MKIELEKEIKAGCIVISKSGRDKGKLFVVVDVQDRYVYIADGKLRKIEKPKKKNKQHLQLTNMFLTIDDITGNKALYKILLDLKNR